MVTLGSEYANISKKPQSKKRLILQQLAEDEKKFIYAHPGGRIIFTPVYKAYSKLFFQNIVDNTEIKTSYEAFKDTSIFERFMLNTCQFSAAKSRAEAKMMQQLVYKDDKLQDYGRFKKQASEVTDIFQETWLRTEYDTSTKQAIQGAQFERYRADKDLYPYWLYVETTSDHPREEHLELVGNVYRIGDPEGDAICPQNGWNCNCSSEQVDDQYLEENNKEVTPGGDDIDKVDPQFRFNPADQGILPRESHSYFEVLKNANEADYKMFGLDKMDEPDTLKAKGLHLLVQEWHKWQTKYHTKGTDIIFQNKETLTNIVFNHSSFQAIQNHADHIDMLPETLMNPTEIWQSWVSVTDQKTVRRIYIKDGYSVETVNGIIKDAWYGTVNKYRTGVLI